MTEEREDYIIIVGAMKSGTTTLFSILAEHPQIAPAKPKEPGFFAFEDIHDRGFDWYHGLFPFDPTVHRYRLEASTDYTKAPFVTGVWSRMQQRPQARYKLIYIMRHPLRQLESHARHVQRTRKEIGQVVSPRADHSFDNGVSLASLSMTRYAAQLDAYRVAIAAGDMFITTLEELTLDPGGVIGRLYDFLDLPPPPIPVSIQQRNAAKGRTRVHAGWRTLSRIPLLMKIGKYLLPDAARERIKLFFRRKYNAEGRFFLTAQEKVSAADQLDADLMRLQSEYGVDVPRLWGLRPGRAGIER